MDAILLDLARALGASMVLLGIAAFGIGLVALAGGRSPSPMIGAAARLAQELCIGGAVLGVGGGALGLFLHWRSGAATTGGFLLAELALLGAGIGFALVARHLMRRRHRA